MIVLLALVYKYNYLSPGIINHQSSIFNHVPRQNDGEAIQCLDMKNMNKWDNIRKNVVELHPSYHT